MRTEDVSMFGMGQNPSPEDKRDWQLSMFEPANLGDLTKSKMWPFNSLPLEQGETPHCVGFGGANWGINEPIQDMYTNADGHAFYDLCKIIDGEPGAQNGSTIRTIAKVLRNAGRLDGYAFAKTVDAITYWIINHGPVIIGTIWTVDMCVPDKNNVIHPTGKVAGGHCSVINETVDGNLFGIQNSWGLRWGINGKAYISRADFQSIFMAGGEAMAAVELPIKAVAKESCITTFARIFQNPVPA